MIGMSCVMSGRTQHSSLGICAYLILVGIVDLLPYLVNGKQAHSMYSDSCSLIVQAITDAINPKSNNQL